MTDLPSRTVAEVQAMLRTGEVSPREILQALEDQIAALDPQIGAYLSRDFEAALAEAEQADLSKPLGGVPIAVKDLINVAGQPCSCASRSLGGYRAPYSATVIQRLRAAGAVPFGRTNMDEFAMGSSTENSSLQVTRNPWDRARVPGGSSGGSAAAVAANLAFAALGTDTGGSIRQPAAFCGVVGLKPTYGRVSRYGVTAFASSLDQVGPLTKTVRDAALLLNALAGGDAKDSTCLDKAVPDYTALLGREINGLRIGQPKEYMAEGIDPFVRAAVDEAARHFADLGAELSEVSLPHTEYGIATYNILAMAEASANLARFDGVRYGHRAGRTRNLLEHYGRTRAEGFGPEVKRRIILGTYVLSAGYYDDYYLQAQKVRALIRRDFTEAFQKVDLILAPTTPTPAFRLGEKSADPLQMYLADIFTNTANLAGICGISLPCGVVVSPEGRPLPIGLQLLGQPLDEARLLQTAHAYEQSTAWHIARPE